MGFRELNSWLFTQKGYNSIFANAHMFDEDFRKEQTSDKPFLFK